VGPRERGGQCQRGRQADRVGHSFRHAHGPVPVPGGNRGEHSPPTPQGKPGASGTPDFCGSKSEAKGRAGEPAPNSSLPPACMWGAADSGATSPCRGNGRRVRRNGRIRTANGEARRWLAVRTQEPAPARALPSPVSDDRSPTWTPRFLAASPYSMTLNMPNLNSSTGSWVMRLRSSAEDGKKGNCWRRFPPKNRNPAIRLELMRANVHGVSPSYCRSSTLTGRLSGHPLLNSPTTGWIPYAAKALRLGQFAARRRAGKASGARSRGGDSVSGSAGVSEGGVTAAVECRASRPAGRARRTSLHY